MKSPKGFRGKYFSLAAILALNATITLASNVQSVVDTQEQLQTPRENATSEEETLSSELLAPVMVVSKKIKEQKSEVVTASKSKVLATNVTDNVSIITSEELSQKGISTVSEALNTIAGISITSSGGLGATKSIFLQGMANKYTLLMIDGVRYNDPSNTTGADFSHLLVSDIERIEVIKGAQSGVWGADAAAGVINIITKNSKNGTLGSAGVELGSYGHKSANVSFSHKTNTLDVMLFVQRVMEDGFSTQAPYGKDIDQYENDPYRNTTVNLKAGYWMNEHNRIEAGYHDVNALSSYDEYPLPNSSQHSDFRNRSGFLIYKYFSGNQAIETTLSQSTFSKKELNAFNSWELKDFQGNVPSFEFKDTWKYNQTGPLVLGSSFEKRDIQYTKVAQNEQERQENSTAFYINNTNKLDKLVLTEALRYDTFSAFENKLTGKLGAKYFLNDQLNVYTNYGTAYKAPSMLEMINPWGVSNLELKPENIQSFNAGISYAGFNINFFRNEISDMMLGIYNVATHEYKYMNVDGTSTFKGIELSYEQQLFASVLAGIYYTYTDAKKESGSRLTNIPRYQTTLYATYMPIKQVALNINGTYLGSRKDDFTANETGNYFVANTKLTYHIDQNWDIYVKVNNLFDCYYQTVYGYASAERSYYAGLQARF